MEHTKIIVDIFEFKMTEASNAPIAKILFRNPFYSGIYNILVKNFGNNIFSEFGIGGPGYMLNIKNDLVLLEKILGKLKKNDRDAFCNYYNIIERNDYQKLFDILHNSNKTKNIDFCEKNNIKSSKHLRKYIEKNIEYYHSNKNTNNILKLLNFSDDRNFFRIKIIGKFLNKK